MPELSGNRRGRAERMRAFGPFCAVSAGKVAAPKYRGCSPKRSWSRFAVHALVVPCSEIPGHESKIALRASLAVPRSDRFQQPFQAEANLVNGYRLYLDRSLRRSTAQIRSPQTPVTYVLYGRKGHM